MSRREHKKGCADELMPRQARYWIETARMRLKRGLRDVRAIKPFTGFQSVWAWFFRHPILCLLQGWLPSCSLRSRTRCFISISLLYWSEINFIRPVQTCHSWFEYDVFRPSWKTFHFKLVMAFQKSGWFCNFLFFASEIPCAQAIDACPKTSWISRGRKVVPTGSIEAREVFNGSIKGGLL